MNFLEHRFTLDVRRDASKVCVRVRKGDTARRLRIALVQGVVPYEIRSDCYAVFSAVKPDGNRLFNPCTIEDNRIVYELTPQTTAVIGLVECEIRLYGADDALITSPGFDLIVDEVLYDEDKVPQSETEVNALTGLISDAAEVIAEGRGMIGEFGSALGQIEGVRDEAEAAAEEAAKQAQAAADAAKSVNTKLAEELAKEIEELKKRPTSDDKAHSRNGGLSVARALNDGGRKSVRALISFTDDDCRKEVYYRVDVNKPSLFEVIQNYNIPYTLTCPPGNIRPTGNPKDDPNDDKYLTWTDVKAMYHAGVAIACHHWRQYNMDDTGWYPTIDSYAADLQQCMDKFAEQGIDVQGVAYPQGKYVPEYIPAVKKHYHFGLTVDRGINRSPYATYYLNRCEVFPDTSAYKNNPTLALKEAKARVDDVAQNGGWLIFMTHAWYETFNAADLGSLIEYIQSQGIEIVSVADALKATGNVIEVGDFRKTAEELEKPYFVVDATGNVYANSVQEYTNYTEKVTEMQVGWRGEGNWYLTESGKLMSHDADTNRRVSVDIPVSAGEKYRISCSSVWDGAAYAVLTAADGDGNRSVVDIKAGTAETPYTIVNREITIPDGGAILRLSSNVREDIQPEGYKISKVEYIGAPAVNSPTGNAPTLNGPESILSYGTVLSADEVCIGKYSQGILEPTFKYAVATKDFVKPFVVSATLISADYQFAVAVYKDGVYVKTEGWLSNGTSYAFDHTAYQYKLYIGQVVNGYVYDFDACRKSVVLTISAADILKSYNALEAKSDAERRNTRNAVEYMMRRNYDISYANAPEPIGLTTYVGNNQIVHPKVLYFPNKFGGYKYWMAYTPYPFANDVYENPCVAHSNDGYNWLNIDGNPLDDPGGDGYNSDTHLVYVESTGTLEIWYRYVSNYETTPVSEIIYRQTTKDGINWTEKEIVIENDSGDYVQYLSPAVVHDGEKYKVWVVNSTSNTISYYESGVSTTGETIALDDSMTVGKVTQAGKVDETDTNYMYTEKIKLNAAKSFQLTGVNLKGTTVHPALRYVTAYDAEGNVLTDHCLQSVAEATVSNGRTITMDESVDSVIISIYKAFDYTGKTVALPAVESDGGLTKVRDITLNYQDGEKGYKPWHIDVIEDNGKTVLLVMCKSGTDWSLFLSTSDNNVTFTTPKLVMVGNPYGWDTRLYRSSIVNVDGEYRIYYSAQDEIQKYGLGVCTSNTLSNFVGNW